MSVAIAEIKLPRGTAYAVTTGAVPEQYRRSTGAMRANPGQNNTNNSVFCLIYRC